MFITKTMNESVEQFDLIDSICESYEDLIQINDTLAHLDIKEQELICTESTEIDTFREEAMDRAKEILNNFITKLKVKWSKFLAFINGQIIKYCDDNIRAFMKNNTATVNELNTAFKKGDFAKAGSNNALNRYFSTYVVKGQTVVPLVDFVNEMGKVLLEFLYKKFKMGIELEEEEAKKEMERDVAKEFTDTIKHNIGEFVNAHDNKTVTFPVDSVKDFTIASKVLRDVINKSNKTFEGALRGAESGAKNTNNSGLGIYHRYYNWVYVNSVKIYNIFLSMCRKYFVSLVSSVKRIAKSFESDK